MLKVCWICLFLACTLSGCTFSLDWLKGVRAERAAARGDFDYAIKILKQLTHERSDSDKALSSARQGARVAHLQAKDYHSAVEFYQAIILRSPDPEERLSAQRFIAQIYFENLQDHSKAVVEYERLLKVKLRAPETFKLRLNLAKSHYQLNNSEQALNEIDTLLSGKLTNDEIFEAKSLKASVYLSARQLEEAAQLWQAVLREFPERAKKENVAMNLVVCYEELKNFSAAIEILESMKDDYSQPDFLDLRIQRLKERQANLPGAQGWKR